MGQGWGVGSWNHRCWNTEMGEGRIYQLRQSNVQPQVNHQECSRNTGRRLLTSRQASTIRSSVPVQQALGTVQDQGLRQFVSKGLGAEASLYSIVVGVVLTMERKLVSPEETIGNYGNISAVLGELWALPD